MDTGSSAPRVEGLSRAGGCSERAGGRVRREAPWTPTLEPGSPPFQEPPTDWRESPPDRSQKLSLGTGTHPDSRAWLSFAQGSQARGVSRPSGASRVPCPVQWVEDGSRPGRGSTGTEGGPPPAPESNLAQKIHAAEASKGHRVGPKPAGAHGVQREAPQPPVLPGQRRRQRCLPGTWAGQGGGHFLCWDRQCPRDGVHLEPQKVTLFGTRVFVEVID